MIKRTLQLLLCMPILALAQTAIIKVDTDRRIGQVDPRIYGVFMEPIGFNRGGVSGNTLYGPVYDPESPMADEHGFKTNYIAAAKELQLTNMRWPGGNFVASYDWRDGIGPKAGRPKRQELAWGVVESNQVGTDEWIQLNKAIGSENVLCINAGTGTINDARFWVEYCNAPTGTYWADKRAEFGHPEPYNIKYWCLGNEVDGAPWIIAHKDVEDYCKFAKEVAKAMDRASPAEIEFIASGSSWYQSGLNAMDWVEWNWKVINELHGIADFISIHRYWELEDDYYDFVGRWAVDIDEKISITAAQAKTVADIYEEEPMYISFDEWAPHGRGHLSTLAIAQFFNAFIRHADMVKMANFTLLTSILGRDLATGETFKSPVFYVFKMYSTRCRGESLDAFVDCDTFDVSEHYSDIPYLDVTSTYNDESNELVINVVNRHRDEAIETDIVSQSGDFASSATAYQIQTLAEGDDLNAPYRYDQRDTYEPTKEEIVVSGCTLHYQFPPHSFTQIVVPLGVH